jgi:hypothetical protein
VCVLDRNPTGSVGRGGGSHQLPQACFLWPSGLWVQLHLPSLRPWAWLRIDVCQARARVAARVAPLISMTPTVCHTRHQCAGMMHASLASPACSAERVPCAPSQCVPWQVGQRRLPRTARVERQRRTQRPPFFVLFMARAAPVSLTSRLASRGVGVSGLRARLRGPRVLQMHEVDTRARHGVCKSPHRPPLLQASKPSRLHPGAPATPAPGPCTHWRVCVTCPGV